MSRTSSEDRDRIRGILDAIESGEIVIKQASEEVVQEFESRMRSGEMRSGDEPEASAARA